MKKDLRKSTELLREAWSYLMDVFIFSPDADADADADADPDLLYKAAKAELGRDRINLVIDCLLSAALDANDLILHVDYWGKDNNAEQPIASAALKPGRIGMANGMEFESHPHGKYHFYAVLVEARPTPESEKRWRDWIRTKKMAKKGNS